jgi:beta-glucanase (GH16 family)
MSGRVSTVNSVKVKYGRVEVRAKLPKGDWLWPAIWLMPVHNEYGPWPASGEIDVMESRGNVNYPKEFGGGPESFGSTLHWGSDFYTNQYMKTHAEYSLKTGKTFADDFHTFGLGQ